MILRFDYRHKNIKRGRPWTEPERLSAHLPTVKEVLKVIKDDPFDTLSIWVWNACAKVCAHSISKDSRTWKAKAEFSRLLRLDFLTHLRVHAGVSSDSEFGSTDCKVLEPLTDVVYSGPMTSEDYRSVKTR